MHFLIGDIAGQLGDRLKHWAGVGDLGHVAQRFLIGPILALHLLDAVDLIERKRQLIARVLLHLGNAAFFLNGRFPDGFQPAVDLLALSKDLLLLDRSSTPRDLHR